MKQLRHLVSIGCLLLTTASFAQSKTGGKQYTLTSPDGSLSVRILVSNDITYQLTRQGKTLVAPSVVDLKTDQPGVAGRKVAKAATGKANGVFHPVVWQQSSEVVDRYNSLRLDFKGDLSLEWRVYDNGIAWRWIDKGAGPYKVLDEQATVNMTPDARAWYPEEKSFYSHNERKYIRYKAGDIDSGKLASLPALFESEGVKLLLTESSLFNYAGMWIHGDGHGGIRATFPHFPKEKKITGDRDERVLSREDFIAKINGPQEFPWRILMVAPTDKDLLNNQLPMLLGRPADGDYSWVRPGKVQWDWWHNNNVYEVDFRSGINNDTYKYYIDFAAKYGIEYVLLDEGWCDTRDLMKQRKDINVQELAAYGRSKGVNILLWTSWLVLDRQLDMALDSFASWGIKGIKVDFMQRDDQEMVNYYEKVARAAAKRKMMVDFHGAYKPTGWVKSYPNIVTSEGVMGNEESKFTTDIDPPHTIDLPFTRMAAGPMDYTPGGMRNVTKKEFFIDYSEPMTMGTRCNQLAMYVVYLSPWQMLCDIPTHYLHEPECMQFLRPVPTVWRKTVPLDAVVGQYVAIARQAPDNSWFIGAMTDWTPRDLTLDLSFLDDGQYTLQYWKDGINADKNAKDFKMGSQPVTKGSKIPVHLAPGGGYVAHIVPTN